MKRKQNNLNRIRGKNGRSKVAIITFLHAFNVASKAVNDLLVFVAFQKLFQMHTPLEARLFCPEDILNRGIMKICSGVT